VKNGGLVLFLLLPVWGLSFVFSQIQLMDWLWCMIPEGCFTIVNYLIECVELVLEIES